MTKFWLILVGIVACVSCETNWIGLARLVNPTGFFTELMQETMLEVERREWCNLGLLDIHQTLNESMYHWHVQGEVTYTNGFLISVQKIDLSDFGSSVITRTLENNTTILVARVNGMLNLRDVKVGYDAVVHLTGEDVQHYTGVFTHTLIQLSSAIEKNLITNTLTSSSGVSNLSGGPHGMLYMPANNLTEVLSRRYVSGGIWDSVGVWGREIIASIMLEVATNKIAYPEVCYNNC